jgi:phenylalanyl-tRNA synthetase alpha subunit
MKKAEMEMRVKEINKIMRELAEEKKRLLEELNSIQVVEIIEESSDKSYEEMNLQELKQVAKSKGYKIRTTSVKRFIKELHELDYFYENKGKIFMEC